LYLAGILAGLLTAFILSKSLIREKSPGFIMELPPYRLPRLSNLLINTWNKLHGFVEKAGTLILAASLVIWALSYFPAGVSFGGIASLIGRIGALIAPIFAPLHFDPTMTVGLLAGFSAKEVVISTIGVVSGQSGQALRAVIAAQMSPATALAYLSFILLYTPCLATVAVIRSESGSRAWTLFSIVYGLVLAYATALLVRSVALLAGLA
jgi:ferrous iron transport protein B